MENLAFSQFLSLYSWFVTAAILFFVLLIARFYQRFSGESTQFVWFGIVIMFLGISTVRNSSLRRISGDMMADMLAFVGGGLLIILSIQLYRKMSQRKN